MSYPHNPPLSKEEVADLLPCFELLVKFCDTHDCDTCVFCNICEEFADSYSSSLISVVASEVVDYLKHLQEHPFEEMN